MNQQTQDTILYPAKIDHMIRFLGGNTNSKFYRKAKNLSKVMKDCKTVAELRPDYLARQEKELETKLEKIREGYKMFLRSHPAGSQKKLQSEYYKLMDFKKTSYQLKLVRLCNYPQTLVDQMNAICTQKYFL